MIATASLTQPVSVLAHRRGGDDRHRPIRALPGVAPARRRDAWVHERPGALSAERLGDGRTLDLRIAARAPPVGRTLKHEASALFDWILVAVLYVAGIAFFRLLGGVGAAGVALQRWGGAYAERRRASNRLPSIASSGPRRDDPR